VRAWGGGGGGRGVMFVWRWERKRGAPIHPLIHPLIHPPIHPLIHPLIHPPIDSLFIGPANHGGVACWRNACR
jgi:hypothetical protein